MKKKSKKKASKKKKKKLFKNKFKKVNRNPRKKSNIKRKKNKSKKIKFKKKKYKKVKRIKKVKKIKQPLDRLRSIKLPKIKFKRIKISKLKFKKKKLIIFKKKFIRVRNASFQRMVNFILAPFFRAYDDFRVKRNTEKIKNFAFEKKEKEKKLKDEERLKFETKQKELRDEIKFAKERDQDLKKFIRHEQAILRKEQAEKRRRFLEEIKLEKKIESFKKRELEEIKNLEKLALREQRDDYRPVEERLEKIKEKYRLIREQKIRERIEALGVHVSDSDTREDLLKKEKEYAAYRETIETVLESFYRSAASLIFQINKRWIPKHKSILRVIDRRYESNECFIRYDDSPDEDFLVLIYLEDSDTKKGKIIVENKTNPERHETKSFATKEIFTYSDYLVDAITSHIDRERKKKSN
mgnify:CR=1 FL=1